MKIELKMFGSKECEKCLKMEEEMKKYGFDYTYIDANADDTQALCDALKIDQLPVIHAIDADNNKLIASYTGYISPVRFLDVVIFKLKANNEEIK